MLQARDLTSQSTRFMVEKRGATTRYKWTARHSTCSLSEKGNRASAFTPRKRARPLRSMSRAAESSTAPRKTLSSCVGQFSISRVDPWPTLKSRWRRDTTDPPSRAGKQPGGIMRANYSAMAAAGLPAPAARVKLSVQIYYIIQIHCGYYDLGRL